MCMHKGLLPPRSPLTTPLSGSARERSSGFEICFNIPKSARRFG